MHIVSEAQFQAEIEPILRQIFVSDDYFGNAFHPDVLERRVIYPCKPYIESISAPAIVAAANFVGDEGCFIYSLSGTRSSDEPICCYVPLPEFINGYAGEPCSDELIGVRLGMNVYGEEICIFSPSGKWGMMSTMEWFGLLGGIPDFLEILQQQTPGLNEQVYNFLEHLRLESISLHENPDITQNEYLNAWLPELLAHVYGDVSSIKMMEQFMSSPVGYWEVS